MQVLYFIRNIYFYTHTSPFRLISLIIGYEGEMDYSNMNLVMILVVTIFALYGLIDDLVDVGRKIKSCATNILYTSLSLFNVI